MKPSSFSFQEGLDSWPRPTSNATIWSVCRCPWRNCIVERTTASPRDRHDLAYLLFEATIKLAVAPLAATYLEENRRVEAVDRELTRLACPSFGHWVGMLRELARHFGTRADASSHPLGRVWDQLSAKRRLLEFPAIVALYGRIKNGPDGERTDAKTCSLLELFDAIVQYRNGVIGHSGGPRFDSFYENEMGPLLFPAANETLADGVFEPLGVKGATIVHVTDVRMLEDG